MKLSKKGFLDFLLIIIIFACTGTTTVFITALITNLFGLEKWSLPYILLYIFLIFPLYQFLLLVYAFIFRRFDYFFGRQKKIVKRIGSLFSRETANK
jgi:hypothetical protein